jgi:hypothetical protein
MRVSVGEQELRVRAAPRPDPLTFRVESPWTQHAPWLVGVTLLVAAWLALDVETTGRLACGAALMAVAMGLTSGRFRLTWQAIHFAAGIVVLAVWRTPVETGTFALAAGVVLAGALIARAGALDLRDGVAPLAGRLPWRFGRLYRNGAARFAIAGLCASILMSVIGVSPAMRVAAIALLPAAVRAYIGNLLSSGTTHALWIFCVTAHVTLLAVLAPTYGAVGAAWALVITETLLFAGTSVSIARRTGESPFTVGHFTAVVAAGLMLISITIPSTPEWIFLVAMVAGAVAGAIFFPRMRDPRRYLELPPR